MLVSWRVCQMGIVYMPDGNMSWIFLNRWNMEMIVGVEFSQRKE